MDKKYFADFNTLPCIDISEPPMKRQIFFGDNILVGRNIIKAHTLVPMHSHKEEQFSVVVKGECDVTACFEEGTITKHCTQGGIVWFPSNIKHEVKCTSDEDCEIWDWFSPVRKDWLPK